MKLVMHEAIELQSHNSATNVAFPICCFADYQLIEIFLLINNDIFEYVTIC